MFASKCLSRRNRLGQGPQNFTVCFVQVEGGQGKDSAAIGAFPFEVEMDFPGIQGLGGLTRGTLDDDRGLLS